MKLYHLRICMKNIYDIDIALMHLIIAKLRIACCCCCFCFLFFLCVSLLFKPFSLFTQL